MKRRTVCSSTGHIRLYITFTTYDICRALCKPQPRLLSPRVPSRFRHCSCFPLCEFDSTFLAWRLDLEYSLVPSGAVALGHFLISDTSHLTTIDTRCIIAVWDTTHSLLAYRFGYHRPTFRYTLHACNITSGYNATLGSFAVPLRAFPLSEHWRNVMFMVRFRATRSDSHFSTSHLGYQVFYGITTFS